MKNLCSLSEDYHASTPVRATATYFLGKLWRYPRALKTLCDRALHDNESWGDGNYQFPIRYEAAKALSETDSPQAWETLIDLCFADVIYPYRETLVEWAAYLTDTLSGLPPSVSDDKLPRASWFDALIEATDDLDELLANRPI